MFSVCQYVCVLTALVSPNVQLLGKLRYDQESPPSLTLLGLQNVSKNVVPNVDDVLSFDAQQIAHNVRRTCKNSHQGLYWRMPWLLQAWAWASGKEESGLTANSKVQHYPKCCRGMKLLEENIFFTARVNDSMLQGSSVGPNFQPTCGLKEPHINGNGSMNST